MADFHNTTQDEHGGAPIPAPACCRYRQPGTSPFFSIQEALVRARAMIAAAASRASPKIHGPDCAGEIGRARCRHAPGRRRRSATAAAAGARASEKDIAGAIRGYAHGICSRSVSAWPSAHRRHSSRPSELPTCFARQPPVSIFLSCRHFAAASFDDAARLMLTARAMYPRRAVSHAAAWTRHIGPAKARCSRGACFSMPIYS